MKRISIAGIDGSGKTTLVSSLQDNHQECILFSPQTFKNPTLPLYQLSKTIDQIGKWADENQVPVMKGISLFLGMTLYKKVVSSIEETINPSRLIVERYPIIDTMAYAKFFLPMLNQAIPIDKIHPGLSKIISESQFEIVNEHIKNLTTNDTDLFNLNYFIFNLLNAPREKVFNNLINFYQLSPPDLHLLLTLTAATIPARFNDRKVVGAHENAKILTMLQNEMIEVCHFIKSKSDHFNFILVDADKSAPQVELEVLGILKNY